MSEMNLTLTVSSYDGDTPAGRAQKRFAQVGGCIGRDASNDWVLPDPALVLSRTHATIAYKSNSYFITDTSRNGVFVNDRLLGKGNQVKLADGDTLRFGNYDVQVRIEPASAAMAEPVVSASADGIAPAAPEAPADLPPRADTIPPNSILEQGVGDFSLPPDWFVGPEGDSQMAKDELPPSPAERFQPQHEALAGRVRATTGPSPGGAPPQTPGGEEPRFSGFSPWPTGHETPPPGEWPGDLAPSDEGGSPLPLATDLPPAQAVPQAGLPPAPQPPPGPAEGGLAAFFHGAGIPREQAKGYDEQALEQAGRLFRRLIQGTMEILAARTRVKQEFQLERTSIQACDNNPLKFLPSPEEAITQLLLPGEQAGYLPPAESIDEAFADIEAHQIATFAGIQAAFRGMFARFNPASLEQEFSRHAGLGVLIPLHKKAKCWDLFTERFDTLAREAEDDFQQLFGKEFALAYKKQSERLKQLEDHHGDREP